MHQYQNSQQTVANIHSRNRHSKFERPQLINLVCKSVLKVYFVTMLNLNIYTKCKTRQHTLLLQTQYFAVLVVVICCRGVVISHEFKCAYFTKSTCTHTHTIIVQTFNLDDVYKESAVELPLQRAQTHTGDISLTLLSLYYCDAIVCNV